MSGSSKRKREESEVEELRCVKKARLDQLVSAFEVPELVENIAKYLIEYPETILSISQVSKMHYAIMHSKQTWIKFGFSLKLCEDNAISNRILLLILAQTRLLHKKKQFQKLQRTLELLEQQNESLISELSNGSHTLEADKLLVRLGNPHLTDSATEALMKIIRRTVVRPFTVWELVEWLEQPFDTPIKQEEIEKTFYYPGFGDGYGFLFEYCEGSNYAKEMKHIVTIGRDSPGYYCIIFRFLMANPAKSLLLMCIDINDRKYSNFFIKLDRSKNVVECCGNLEVFVAKKFNESYAKALNYLCEVKRPDNDDWGLHYLERHDIRVEEDDLDDIDEKFQEEVAENIQYRK